jgi:hypothetical protein
MTPKQIANKARYVLLQAARTVVVALEAPPPPPPPPPLTTNDMLRIARGCTDYKGGYDGAEYEAFQAGVGTVICALERADLRDTQTLALWHMGKKS